MADVPDIGLFEDQIKEQVKMIREDIEDIHTEIQPKLDQVEALKYKIELLEKYLSVSATPENQLKSKLKLVKNARSRGETITDFAVGILEDIGNPIHYIDIMREIESKHNFTIPGKAPKANMTAHLNKDARIARFGKGIYGLADWHEELPGGPMSGLTVIDAYKKTILDYFRDKSFRQQHIKDVATEQGLRLKGKIVTRKTSSDTLRDLLGQGFIVKIEHGIYKYNSETAGKLGGLGEFRVDE